MTLYGLFVFTSFVVYTSSRSTSGTTPNCVAIKSCKECISAGAECGWCDESPDESSSGNSSSNATLLSNIKLNSRCIQSSAKSSCKGTLIDPTSDSDIIENLDYTESSTVDFTSTVIQMRPQRVSVKLRKGQTEKVNITFRKIIDYPLDLYYVMDLSNSMKDDLENLQSLGTKLIDDIRENITKNVQVGFGSFVDKVMMPYTSTIDAQLNDPCSGDPNLQSCAPPFGFRHQLEITDNATAFENIVKNTRVSANIDIPEGSFDALMQIAVCEEFVKWRRGSTRVVLLTTDATPHIALDGKLAAILEANDMKCHLEAGYNSRLEAGAVVYSKSKTMDYPSLGQLKKVFTDHNIHAIFAVTEDVLPLYNLIPNVLEQRGVVSELANDSSNIRPLIAQAYDKIKSRIFLETTSAPDGVTLTHRTFCADNPPVTDNMDCNNIYIGNQVVVELSFTSSGCFNRKDQVNLTSSTISDIVMIDIEYICDCDCNTTMNSSSCNGHGSLTCGLCTCKAGKEGSQCQCNTPKEGEDSHEKTCTKPGSSNGVCEGRGECDCGKCTECAENYNGTYCHCLTTSCPNRDGKVCGGNGWCNCSIETDEKECICFEPYKIRDSDKTCSCDPNNCIKDSESKVCSGRGSCNCETCVCNNTNLWGGTYCEDCQDPQCTGIAMTCEEEIIRKCAECMAKNDECKEVCAADSKYILYTRKDSLINCGSCTNTSTSSDCTDCRKHDTSKQSRTCSKVFADNCKYDYQIFWTNEHRYRVYVKRYDKDADCPEPIPVILIIGPTVGAIVLIGILLLILWKLYINYRDRREYERWVEEEKKRKWTKGENPIFETPEDKFTNPMFAGDADE